MYRKSTGKAAFSPVNRKALAIKKLVQEECTHDEIYKQTQRTNTAIASNTNESLLSNMTRGDSPINQYSGSSISPVSLKIRMQTLTGTQRVIVFQWLSPGTPAVTDILNTASVFAPLNLANRRVYRILSDQFWNDANGGGRGPSALTSIYVPGKAMQKVMFHTVAASGVVTTGDIRLLIINDTAQASSYSSEILYADD